MGQKHLILGQWARKGITVEQSDPYTRRKPT